MTSQLTPDTRAKVAAVLGLPDDQIGSVTFELNALRQLGALVDIDVQGISMFSVAATWAEWGIADQDERHKRLRGGVKVLIPELYVKRLRTVETRLRQITDKYSTEVTGFRPYRWIPFTAYETWRSEWDRLAAEWDGVKRDILERYDEFVDLLSKDFAVIAGRAWTSITAQGYESIQVKGKVFKTRAQFVDYVVQRVQDKMPTKARIKSGLVVGYRTALLADTADLNERFAAQERALAERAAAEQATQLQQAQYEERIYAMRQAEMENARRLLSEMGSPLEEVVLGLRNRILEQVQNMLDSVQKNGFVRGKIATQASGLLEFYDLMAVTSDAELRDKLARLKSEIGPVGKSRDRVAPERDVARITALLEETLALGEAEIEQATVDSRFASLELF